MSYVKPHMRNGKPVKGYTRSGGSSTNTTAHRALRSIGITRKVGLTLNQAINTKGSLDGSGRSRHDKNNNKKTRNGLNVRKNQGATAAAYRKIRR